MELFEGVIRELLCECLLKHILLVNTKGSGLAKLQRKSSLNTLSVCCISMLGWQCGSIARMNSGLDLKVWKAVKDIISILYCLET